MSERERARAKLNSYLALKADWRRDGSGAETLDRVEEEIIDLLAAALSAPSSPVSREREAIDLITRFLAAMEAAVAEGERAEKTGRAWSSAPLVRQLRIVEEMRQFIGLATPSAGAATGAPGQVEGCPCWACNENWPEAPVRAPVGRETLARRVLDLAPKQEFALDAETLVQPANALASPNAGGDAITLTRGQFITELRAWYCNNESADELFDRLSAGGVTGATEGPCPECHEWMHGTEVICDRCGNGWSGPIAGSKASFQTCPNCLRKEIEELRAAAAEQPRTQERETLADRELVIDATLRESGNDDWTDIECRFANGEKFAAVKVSNDRPALAAKILAALRTPEAWPLSSLAHCLVQIADGKPLHPSIFEELPEQWQRLVRSLPTRVAAGDLTRLMERETCSGCIQGWPVNGNGNHHHGSVEICRCAHVAPEGTPVQNIPPREE